jgi:hypothetical protein
MGVMSAANLDPENDRQLVEMLRRVARQTSVPDVDPLRQAELLRAFDAARHQPRTSSAGYWWMGTLAAAAAALMAVALPPAAGRHQPGDQRAQALLAGANTQPPTDAVGEFVVWPGSAELPPLESGQLLRIDLPVSVLPALGLMPPASRVTSIKADLLVGQDGLARAVRLVSGD